MSNKNQIDVVELVGPGWDYQNFASANPGDTLVGIPGQGGWRIPAVVDPVDEYVFQGWEDASIWRVRPVGTLKVGQRVRATNLEERDTFLEGVIEKITEDAIIFRGNSEAQFGRIAVEVLEDAPEPEPEPEPEPGYYRTDNGFLVIEPDGSAKYTYYQGAWITLYDAAKATMLRDRSLVKDF